MSLADDGGQRAALVGEATEDQRLGREKEGLRVVEPLDESGARAYLRGPLPCFKFREGSGTGILRLAARG